MAANKRARQKGLLAQCVSSDKCVYTLPPFDRCFDPVYNIKNKYNIKGNNVFNFGISDRTQQVHEGYGDAAGGDAAAAKPVRK